jgi:delta-1-pyrroline-5-carboxylate synthetase
MAAKINAALSAVAPGSTCTACVVASGGDFNTIRSVLGSDLKFGSNGTLFCTPGSKLEEMAINHSAKSGSSTDDISDEAREKAVAARTEARKLQALPFEVRRDILLAMADALINRKEKLLAANSIDLEAAERDATALVLKKRLKLTDAKLETLAEGLRQIASLADPLGVEKAKREIADGMTLSLITVPIGVLMIIFESRPDSMPQIAALSIASGNGLLLKGGKEAVNSNSAIYEVLGDAIEHGSKGAIKRDIIALITSRGQVSSN